MLHILFPWINVEQIFVVFFCFSEALAQCQSIDAVLEETKMKRHLMKPNTT
jgi:hypothetical protein